MEKGADLALVAPEFVTADALVLIGVVKPLDRRVALCALEATWALVPTDSLQEHLTILGRILKDLGWTAEITHVMRVDAALAVVAVFLGWAPGCLVHKHVENEAVLIQVQTLQVVIQVRAQQKTFRNKVVLNTLVLEVQIDVADCLQVPQAEVGHLVGLA